MLDAETSRDLYGLTSVFEARRRISFDEIYDVSADEMVRYCAQLGMLDSEYKNTNGESQKTIFALPDLDVSEIYDCVLPVVESISRAIESRVQNDLDELQRRFQVMRVLKSLYVSDLWYHMNVPDTPLDLRVDVEKNIDWQEFFHFKYAYEDMVDRNQEPNV